MIDPKSSVFGLVAGMAIVAAVVSVTLAEAADRVVDGSGQSIHTDHGTEVVTVSRNGIPITTARRAYRKPLFSNQSHVGVGPLINGDFSDIDPLHGWMTSESDGATAPGAVTQGTNKAVFSEGDSFLVTLQQTFLIPDTGALSLSFDLTLVPGFDLTDNFIPDAFEASLLDASNLPVVTPWDALATSFFNMQEDSAVNTGATTTWGGLTVTADLTGVPGGTEVTLFFDLIGADADTTSGVTIDNVVLLGLNEPPVCDAGGPYVAECNGANTTVTLDASASFDPDLGDTISFAWATDCAGTFGHGALAAPTLTLGAACPALAACTATLTVTDNAGASAVCTAPVTADDTTVPTITCPTAITAECDGLGNTAAFDAWSATTSASDTCGAATVVGPVTTFTPACGLTSSTDGIWTATDDCGLTNTCSSTFTVADTTPPDLTCPADIFASGGVTGAVVDFAPTVSDVCDASPVVSTSVAPGSLFGRGVTPVTAIAADACGNARTCSFDVNVACFGVNRLQVGTKDVRCEGIALLEVTSFDGLTPIVGIYIPAEGGNTSSDGEGELPAGTIVNDGINGPQMIDTSCSQALEIGLVFGAYTVTDLIKIFDEQPEERGNEIELRGSFDPALPIDLAADDVTYTIEDGNGYVFSLTIPAGSFVADGDPTEQEFEYEVKPPLGLEVEADFNLRECKFKLGVQGVQNTNLVVGTTLTVTLQVGVNVASEALLMIDKKNHLVHKKKPKVKCCPDGEDSGLVTVVFSADVLVSAERHNLAVGTHPESTREALTGINVCAYDASGGGCPRTTCGGTSHPQYVCISTTCQPLNCCTTDATGECLINLPAGDFVLVAADGTGLELPDPLGAQVSNLVDAEVRHEDLQQLTTVDGKKLSGKRARLMLAGSELSIIEPEFVVWDAVQQLYPFVFEGIGNWNVTVSVDTPVGFVPDNAVLSENVLNETEAVQFSVTEVGSDFVPTETTFQITHDGESDTVRSSVDIFLTSAYASSQGNDVRSLEAQGLIKDPPVADQAIGRGVSLCGAMGSGCGPTGPAMILMVFGLFGLRFLRERK